MKIAVIGATGQIGLSLLPLLAKKYDVFAYARSAEGLRHLQQEQAFEILSLSDFPAHNYDCIINFVGGGTPKKINHDGCGVFLVNDHFDALCVEYLRSRPECGYIFLSTGALYGKNYQQTNSTAPQVALPLTTPGSQDFYKMAKVMCEYRHRAHGDLKISDIRLFGFVSDKLDLEGETFLAQVYNAIASKRVFHTHSDDFVRDYVGDIELFDFVVGLIGEGCPNGAYDIYSKQPTTKFGLLNGLSEQFALKYEIDLSNDNAVLKSFDGDDLKLHLPVVSFPHYTPKRISFDVVCQSYRKLLNDKKPH